MRGITLVLALLLATSTFANADDASTATTANGTSTAQSEASSSSLLNKFYVNYFGVYHGPDVNNITSPYSLNHAGNPQTLGTYFDSTVTAAYKITDSIAVGAYIPFFIVPTLGQGMVLGDLGVTAFDAAVVKTSHLQIWADIVVQGPSSTASQAEKMDLGIKSMPYIRYSIPDSRFTVGAWDEIKSYIGVLPGNDAFKLYTAPYVNYGITDKLSLNVEYEMEAHHIAGTPNTNFTMYETDLQPGFVYSFSPHFMINPYVQVFTGSNVSNNIGLGAVINATL